MQQSPLWIPNAVSGCLLMVLASYGQTVGTPIQPVPRADEPITLKGFEVAVSYSQSLTQWSLLLFGGTVLLVLGTSYYRPDRRWVLWSYFLFVPSWACLGASMVYGTKVLQSYLAYLWFQKVTALEIKSAMNHYLLRQRGAMEIALLVLAAWLSIYLYWWILGKKTEDK